MTTGPADGTIHLGRWCADLGDRMLQELSAQPDSGLLRFAAWPGRTVLVVQYRESFEKLAGFARSAQQSHLPAWRAFNTAVGDSGDVGI